MKNKMIQFKALRRLHDSGFRLIEIKDENGKVISSGSDVIHLQLGSFMGTWINIDCMKDGTFRIFSNNSEKRTVEFKPDQFPMSSCFVEVKGDVRVGKEEDNDLISPKNID